MLIKFLQKLYSFLKFFCVLLQTQFLMINMDVRSRIIKESFKLLSQKSIRAITMDEIAKDLGISKRTLYENFTDKKNLIRECLVAFKETNKEYVERICKEEENAIMVFIKHMLYSNEVVKQIGYDLIIDIRKFYPDVFKDTIHKDMDENRLITTKHINKAIEQGLVKDNTNVDFIVKMIELNMVYATQGEYLERIKVYNASSVANAHLFLILRGISTQKGIEILDKYDNMFLI